MAVATLPNGTNNGDYSCCYATHSTTKNALAFFKAIYVSLLVKPSVYVGRDDTLTHAQACCCHSLLTLLDVTTVHGDRKCHNEDRKTYINCPSDDPVGCDRDDTIEYDNTN